MEKKLTLREALSKWSAQAQLAFGALSAGLGGFWMFLQQYPEMLSAWGLDQPGVLKNLVILILAVNAGVSAVTVYLRMLPQQEVTPQDNAIS